MRNQLILHIGTHKTGTTTIQKFLADNNKEFEKVGWKYISSRWIANLEQAESYLESIYNGLKEYNILFSNEGLEDINLLNQILPKVEKKISKIKIIIYLRRQDRWIESVYNQNVKTNIMSKEFYEYISICNPQYLNKLDVISDIIGKENLIVRVFEREQMIDNDLITDFCESINLPIDLNCAIKVENQNSGLSLNQLEVKRALNSCFKKMNHMYLLMHHIIYDSYYNLTSKSIKHSSGFLSDEQRKEILDKYAKDNEIIAREYLGREDGILFYDNKPVKYDKIDLHKVYLETKNIFYLIKDAWCKRIYNSLLDIERKQIILNDFEIKMNYFEKELKYEILDKDKCLEIVRGYTKEFIKFEKELSLIEKQVLDAQIAEHEIILMPVGFWTRELLENSSIDVAYVLDNNAELRGEKIKNVEICLPSQINDWNKYFVLIATDVESTITALETQLQSYGLEKNKDYTTNYFCFLTNN